MTDAGRTRYNSAAEGDGIHGKGMGASTGLSGAATIYMPLRVWTLGKHGRRL